MVSADILTPPQHGTQYNPKMSLLFKENIIFYAEATNLINCHEASDLVQLVPDPLALSRPEDPFSWRGPVVRLVHYSVPVLFTTGTANFSSRGEK
jgi:hypothetical protein